MRGEDKLRHEEESWVLSFVEQSDQEQEEFRSRDQEVLENYLVAPGFKRDVDSPYNRGGSLGNRTMRDPESHQVVESLLAQDMHASLGERGFVEAFPRGIEDASAADTVSALTEYNFSRPGTYREILVTKKDSFLFGTGQVFIDWEYREADRLVREVMIDPMGDEVASTYRSFEPIVDDCRITRVDPDDFFPEPGKDTIQKMSGCARRYYLSAQQLEAMIDHGWEEEGVEEALEAGSRDRDDDEWRTDRPTTDNPPGEYGTYEIHEFWGEVPYDHPDGGERRQVILANGFRVKSKSWPLVYTGLPFAEFTVNPIGGRYRGLSPAEVMIYTQDYLNALLMCLAIATVRTTKGMWIYDKTKRIDTDAIRKMDPDIPISALDVNGVKNLTYDARIGEASTIYQALKGQMRQGTGASGGLQGLGLGTKRFSASEAQMTYKQLMERPALTATLSDREFFPRIAQIMLAHSQQFIETSDDLALRVGRYRTMQGPTYLWDILGEFDVEFVGAKRQMSRQETVMALERSFQVVGALPGVAPLWPWDTALVEYAKNMQLYKIAYEVADPQRQAEYEDRVVRSGRAGQEMLTGNGANLPSLDVPGLAPAQTVGRALGPGPAGADSTAQGPGGLLPSA